MNRRRFRFVRFPHPRSTPPPPLAARPTRLSLTSPPISIPGRHGGDGVLLHHRVRRVHRVRGQGERAGVRVLGRFPRPRPSRRRSIHSLKEATSLPPSPPRDPRSRIHPSLPSLLQSIVTLIAQTFIKKRYIRLVPMHWLAILAFAPIVYVNYATIRDDYYLWQNKSSEYHMWAGWILNPFFMHTWIFSSMHYWNAPMWSVSTQCGFYFLFPFLARRMLKKIDKEETHVAQVYTLVPIRPRWRGERDSLRTLPGVSLRPPLAFNPRPRCLSTPLLTPFNSTPTSRRSPPGPTRVEAPASSRSSTRRRSIEITSRARGGCSFGRS